MQPVVAQLHQSGAADGDVVTWDNTAGMWVAAAPSGGGGYTDEQVRDVTAAALTAGTGITVTVNDPGDTITIAVDTTAETERVVDAVAAALTAGTNVTVTYNDGAGTITIAASGGGGGATDIDDLTDVDITTVTPRITSTLLWDGANYVPSTSPDDVPTSPDSWDYEFNAVTSSLPSGWGWTNQGSATYEEKYGRGRIFVPNTLSAVNLKVLDKSVPAGTSWTVDGKFSFYGATGTFNAGMVLRNSSNSKLATWGHRTSGNTVRALHYTNTGVFASQITADLGVMPGTTYYLRMKKNSSTSYDLAYSQDGTMWITYVTANNIEATLGTPTHLGFFCAPENTNNGAIDCHWIRKTA